MLQHASAVENFTVPPSKTEDLCLSWASKLTPRKLLLSRAKEQQRGKKNKEVIYISFILPPALCRQQGQ